MFYDLKSKKHNCSPMTITQETDELLALVIDEKDKIIFKEALGCLQNGFYRTGYIAAWIAITESIKRKIITLSEIGDKAAAIVVAKIIEEEANENSIDGLLMKNAKALSLIEEGESASLQFFWSKRCLFAHPYESAPTQTELLYILQQSIALTLGTPIVYKKSFIENYIVNLRDKPHFLPEDPTAIVNHIAQILPRIASGSKPVLFHTLFAALGGEILNPERQKYQQRMEIWLNELLKHLGGQLDQPEFKLEDKALNFPQTAVYSLLGSEVYAFIPDRVKQILLEYACENRDGIHYEVARQQFAELIGAGLVNAEHHQRFNTYLEANQFSEVHYYYTDPDNYADRLILELRSGDYNCQLPVINALQNPENDQLLEKATISKLVEIGRQIHQAAVYNSWAAQTFLKGEQVAKFAGILQGAFEAAFINGNLLHLRYEYFQGILYHFSRLDNIITRPILVTLLEQVSVAELSSVYNLEYIQKMFENLNNTHKLDPMFAEDFNAVLKVLAERRQKYNAAF